MKDKLHYHPLLNNHPIQTVFGPETDFEGELEYDSSLKIMGRFKGTIKTQGFLIIDEKAYIEANIEAANVILEGTVHGNILAHERVEFLPSGKLYGNIKTMKLKIADGVLFDGNCEMIERAEIPIQS